MPTRLTPQRTALEDMVQALVPGHAYTLRQLASLLGGQGIGWTTLQRFLADQVRRGKLRRPRAGFYALADHTGELVYLPDPSFRGRPHAELMALLDRSEARLSALASEILALRTEMEALRGRLDDPSSR